MEQVKVVSYRHAEGRHAAKLVEEDVNKFSANELPKLGGKIKDIKLSTSATATMLLVTAMIIYTLNEKSLQ